MNSNSLKLGAGGVKQNLTLWGNIDIYFSNLLHWSPGFYFCFVTLFHDVVSRAWLGPQKNLDTVGTE
jgi:hypothetical protein